MNAPTTLAEVAPASVLGTEQVHESAELRGTLYAALVLSPVAHGALRGEGINRAALLAQHGVVAVYTAADIPGENNCGPIVHDNPFLASGTVHCLGQPVAVVVAREMLYAREAAKKAAVLVDELPPVLTIEQALEAGSFVMPSKSVARGDAAATIANAPHRLQGREPTGQLTLYTSSQHPEGNQREAAAALNLGTHDLEVICRRMGGGFGGKEGNASIFSQSAALAAHKLGRPVKPRANRDDDITITGKRHDFRIDWSVGFDEQGRILGLDVMLASRCGHSTDYSGPVNDRAVLHIDNCYFIPNLALVSHRCRTNTQSGTAFRGFGGPQGMFGIENVIDAIARHLGRDPLDVRRANLYREPAASGRPDSMTTHYGQTIEDFVADRILTELEATSGYRARRAELAAFIAGSRWRKRGIALTPPKLGISFTATLLNQGGALVNVFSDGTVSVNHGGTEMGQGLNTKMAQVAADGLGVPLAKVRVTATDTQKVPNASATAASSGADINGGAIMNACEQLRQRLAPVAARLLGCDSAQVRFAGGVASAGDKAVPWAQVAHQAWVERVGLSVTGFYRTPEIGYDNVKLQGRAFYYCCYGAAVTEEEIDTLTCEWTSCTTWAAA